VAQIVPAQVLAAERVDYLVPMRRVSEHGGGDPAVARTGEQTGGRVWSDRGNPAGDELAYSMMSGTIRARLPLVPLSTTPPGDGVVCGPGISSTASSATATARS
jgi:hypothetical protein